MFSFDLTVQWHFSDLTLGGESGMTFHLTPFWSGLIYDLVPLLLSYCEICGGKATDLKWTASNWCWTWMNGWMLLTAETARLDSTRALDFQITRTGSGQTTWTRCKECQSLPPGLNKSSLSFNPPPHPVMRINLKQPWGKVGGQI